MSDSEYTTSEEENKAEDNGLTLNQVNDMVREYERDEKKERKKNALRRDRDENIGNIAIDSDMVNKLELTQAQMKKLKPKAPRSVKQIESAKRLLDIRSKQRKEADEAKGEVEMLKLKVAEKRVYKMKPKEDLKKTKAQLQKELEELEKAEKEEAEEAMKPKKFQARKPKLDDIDEEEVEKKVNKLNQINNAITNNPYYAQILKSRGIKF
jgi:hypothetical protein